MSKSKCTSTSLTQAQQTILDKIVSQSSELKSVLGVLIIRELAKGKSEQEVNKELRIYKAKVSWWQKRWLEATENSSNADAAADDEQLIEQVFEVKLRTDEPQPTPIWENQLQETIDKVYLLESQLRSATDKVSGLDSQSTEVLQRLQRIENKICPPPAPPIKKLIEDAFLKDKENLAKDDRELNDYYQQTQQWATLGITLSQGLEAASEIWEQELLPECRSLKQKLPEEVQEKLKPRHELLELSNRSLSRLREPAAALRENEILQPHLTSVREEELIELLEGNPDEDAARRAIDNKLKQVGHQRYKHIRELEDLAETRRQHCLDFVKRRVLPLIDNLDEGERYSQALVEELKAENSEQKDTLEHWLGFHSVLRSKLLNLLEQVRVYPMKVEIGSLIDYNRHEPFDVENDPDLPNEHIKEVIRRGYEYTTEEDKGSVLLREAQVIVVKKIGSDYYAQ